MSTKKTDSVVTVWISGGETVEEENKINVISNAVLSEKEEERDPRQYYPELGLAIQEITPDVTPVQEAPRKKKTDFSIM